MSDSAPSMRRDRRVVWWLIVGLLTIVGALYVAAYLFTSDRIARGTEISGVAVGGLTPGAAERKLNVDLGEAAARPLQLVAGRHDRPVQPSRLGLTLDIGASVDQVPVGRSWDPRDMWEFVVAGGDYDPVVEVDEQQLDSALASFAERTDRPALEGGVSFEHGRVEPTYPRPGRALEVTTARSAVMAAYPLDSDEPVELQIVSSSPEVGEAEVSRAMREFGNPAVSAPVVFLIGGERVVMPPSQYTRALSMRPVSGRLEPHLNDKALLAALRPALDRIALAPRDASVKIVAGAPQVVSGQAGVTFDPQQITEEFLRLVVAQGEQRQLELRTRIATPELTAAEVRGLGIKEQVSEFTTYFPYAEYRNINMGRAAELINGTVLEPGEVFSLNGIVGERTAANGFTKGFIISDGVFRQELGGGVSQVATTTFNAAFFAGLEDVEHKPHSFYIDRYPVGREATVAWPTVDLKFRNDTPYGVLVQAWRELSTPTTQGAMHVRLWSTRFWDIKAGQSERYAYTSPSTRHLGGDDCTPNSGYGGFDIDVYRYFYRPGSSELDHKETFHTRYTPSDTVICDG